MKYSFEEFLREWHVEHFSGTKDQVEDAFDNWLSDLDGEGYIDLADLYGKKMNLIGFREAKEIALDVLKTN